MSLRSRLRRLRQEAEKGAVLVRQRDGTVEKTFHKGGSEEAERIRQETRQGPSR